MVAIVLQKKEFLNGIGKKGAFKRMKKGIVLFFVCMGLVLSVLGGTSSEAAKVAIRINASSNPQASPDAPTTRWYQVFAEEMTKRSHDTADVKLYWDSQLARSYTDAINGVQKQLIQLTNIPAATLAEFSNAMIPLNALFVVPYPHNEIGWKAFRGPLGERIRQRVIEDLGLRVVAFWDLGFRHILSKDKPIKTVSDLKGVKIRCQPNPIQIAAFKALGTNPTPIPWPELFTSLQQGVVSATENPLANIYTARLYEVTKYLTLTGHLLDYNVVYANEQWYQKLPEEVRKAFDESIILADEAYIEQFKRFEGNYMNIIRGKMTVFEMSKEEREKFKEITLPVSIKEVVKLVGQEYCDYFLGEFARIEKELLKE